MMLVDLLRAYYRYIPITKMRRLVPVYVYMYKALHSSSQGMNYAWATQWTIFCGSLTSKTMQAMLKRATKPCGVVFRYPV